MPTDRRCFVGAKNGEMRVIFLSDLEEKDYDISENGKFVTLRFLNIGRPFALFESIEDLLEDVMTSTATSAIDAERSRIQFWLRKAATDNLDLSQNLEKKNENLARKYTNTSAVMIGLSEALFKPVPENGYLP